MKKVLDWESDVPKGTDPYQITHSSMSLIVAGYPLLSRALNALFIADLSEKQIRAELVQEDISVLYRSQTTNPKDDLTLNQAIIMGLDIEEAQ